MIREQTKWDIFFELSLAVGQSTGVKENCRLFLDTLLQLEGVQGAGIWLKEGPGIWSRISIQPANHDFALSEKSFPSFSSEVERKTGKSPDGDHRDFLALGNKGILVIDWEQPLSPLSGPEWKMLKQVTEKLTISVEGSLSYEQLQKTERRLLSTEQKQRQIIETSPDAVILVDGNACVIEWGPRAERLFQLSAEEAIGHRWYNLVVPYREWEQQDHYLERFQRFGEFPAEQYTPVEIIATDRTGREFPAEMTYSYLRLEGEAHFCLFIRDISGRKASEAELLKAQTRLRALIANLQTGILVESEDRRIVLVNQYFCDIFNSSISPNALQGQDCSQAAERFKGMFVDPQGFVTGIDELLARKEIRTGEELHCRDGRVYERDYIPIYVGEEYLGHMWQYRNVTEQKAKERELVEAGRTAEAAKKAERRFLTNTSHEIRTPMNTVIGMIHLLEDTPINEEQREYLKALRFSADSLLGVINNVLDLSKIEAGEIQFATHPFHLRPLLESLHRSYQLELDGEPVEMNLSVDPAIDRVLIGDDNRLRQILNNLLSNAVKFTERGSIDLSVRLLEDEADICVLEFAVEDTGIGISESEIPLVFENFKQLGKDTVRRYGGSGLGLFIVKQLVEMQGGQIGVESKPGKGSRFWITLPFGKGPSKADLPDLPEEDRKKEKEKVKNDSLNKLRILVVEDDASNQLLIRRILDRWSCRYRLTADAREALIYLSREPFDLILTDLHIPEFSGYDLATQLRHSQDNPNRHTPIIALTAAVWPDERQRVLELGMNDMLTKPFSPDALHEIILKWTGKKDSGQAGTVSDMQSEQEGDSSLKSFRYLYRFSQGDEQFIREMVEAFLEEAPQGLEEMKRAEAAKDWDGLYQTAHRLKPSYEMMELNELKNKLEALEEILKSEPVARKAVRQLLREISSESRRKMEVIRGKL